MRVMGNRPRPHLAQAGGLAQFGSKHAKQKGGAVPPRLSGSVMDSARQHVAGARMGKLGR